jgi:hypothetical protein
MLIYSTMKQAVDFLKRWLTFAKAHKYYSVGAAIFLIAAITAICVIMHAHTNTQLVSTKQTAAHVSKTTKTDQTTDAAAGAPSATTAPKPGNGVAVKSTSSATKTLASPANTQSGLILSPSTFTLTPGSSAPLTVTASNGAAITSPIGMSVVGLGINLGQAAPFKTTWSGSVGALNIAAPGTYTVKLFAQDKTTAGYAGIITINVVRPTMELSVQPLGYDSENDAISYIVHVNRLYGFSESITGVGASSPSEPNLYCAYSVVDSNTIALGCGHDDGTGPTSGSLTITVQTASLARTTVTSYSLPQ